MIYTWDILFYERVSPFEHLPNASGQIKEITLSLTPKRQRRMPFLDNRGKHEISIARQRRLYYCARMGNSKYFSLAYFPY
jgi:hypothetical protein